MKLGTFFAVVAVEFLASQSGGAEYYIDRAHPSASDGNPGTASSPWKSIAKANQALVAGDTVTIKQGTYADAVSPTRSGSASGRITYRTFADDTVTVLGASRAIELINKSYVTVQGIVFSGLDKFLDLENASHNIIAHCTFDGVPGVWTGHWAGSTITDNSQYNWIHHCVFSNFGLYDNDDVGSVLDIGDEESTTDHSDYNLIEDSALLHGGHHVLGVFSRFNVIRNNYLHNENWSNGHGNREIYVNGYNEACSRNLFEGNRLASAGAPPDNTEAAGMNLCTRFNIVRFNCFYDSTGSGLMMSTTGNYYTSPQSNKVYNNTFYRNGQSVNPASPDEELDGIGLANWGHPDPIIGNAIKNNLFHANPASIDTYRVDLAEQTISGNWLQTGNPRFVDITTPINLDDPSIPDFNLRADSPCIDAGVALTTITSTGGTGKTIQLADPNYFTDGWGIVQGDLIRLLGSAQKARITSVDYDTGVVTVDTDLTWTQNQGVAMAFAGAAPDLGAFEFGSAEGADPSISLVPASVNFTALRGGAAPATQTVTVVNGGTTSVLTWTQSNITAWLHVSPAGGTTPGHLDVWADPSGLTVGAYTGLITVAALAASNTPQTASVTLVVESAPILAGRYDMRYADRTALLTAGWDFLGRTAAGATRNTERTSGAVVSYDQGLHPGLLRIPADTGDLWDSMNDTRNTLFRTLPADWTSVRLKLASFNPTLSSQQAGLAVYQDDDNYVEVYRIYEGANYAGFIREVDQNASVVRFVSESTSTDLYLRMDRNPISHLITGFYSLDGALWTDLGSVTQTMSDPRLAIVVGASPSGLPNADVAWIEVYAMSSIRPEPPTNLRVQSSPD